MNKNISEKETASASYILNFYKDVADLTNWYSHYLNLMLELEHKYTTEEAVAKMDDIEKENIKVHVQNIRYFAHRSMIEYKVISMSIKKEKKDKDKDNDKEESLEAVYNEHIKKVYQLDRDKLTSFVEKLNGFLIKTVMQDLLQTAEQLVAEVVDTE